VLCPFLFFRTRRWLTVLNFFGNFYVQYLCSRYIKDSTFVLYLFCQTVLVIHLISCFTFPEIILAASWGNSAYILNTLNKYSAYIERRFLFFCAIYEINFAFLSNKHVWISWTVWGLCEASGGAGGSRRGCRPGSLNLLPPPGQTGRLSSCASLAGLRIRINFPDSDSDQSGW
jgi:hypothetical protein